MPPADFHRAEAPGLEAFSWRGNGGYLDVDDLRILNTAAYTPPFLPDRRCSLRRRRRL